MNLTEYLGDGINQIFRTALYSSYTKTRERIFLLRATVEQKIAARKRLLAEREGNPVPPFLIASIATRCNLHCAGCYARVSQTCTDQAAADELTAGRWGELFAEAKDMGVSFILLAGGEPLERPDVLDEAAKTRGVIFPVFTNGTLLSGQMLKRFDHHRNLVPVISIEGDRSQTDARRGEGMFDLVSRTMREMGSCGIFYGVSVTVTKDNLDTVLGEEFIAELLNKGCRLVLFVEYVPVDGNADPALGEKERQTLIEQKEMLCTRFKDMILMAFPGDEKLMGGCLAAGRGFFHINAFGGAEPCPFSPYSDTSLRFGSIKQALDSALFRKIRESGIEADDHVGGCALFEAKDEVENILRAIQRCV